MEQAHGTSTSGNTRNRGAQKRRNYFITFWNESYPHELPANATYLCTCKDSTKDGKFHGHAFIYFKNPVTMKAVKKLFGNDAHVELPKINSECIDYVLNKDSRKYDFEEFGKRPNNNGCRNVGELLKLEKEEVPPQFANIWQRLKDEAENDIDIEDWHKDVKVYYIQGPSGIGKTERAKQIVRENKEKYGTKVNQVKYENNFWIGLGTAKIAVYDDFRDSHMKASEFVNFIDYNKHVMNKKGGQKINDYELIIITSVQNITEIYKSCYGEPRKQWMRRVEIIDMNPEEENDIDWA